MYEILGAPKLNIRVVGEQYAETYMNDEFEGA